MKKRRTHFAAPFVLVVGCGRPADRDLRAPAPLRPMPIDAAVDVAVDVAVAADVDAEPAPPEKLVEAWPGGPMVNESQQRAHERKVRCSQPIPPAGCNPPAPEERVVPKPIIARVLQVQVQGSYSVVMLSAGSDAGVKRDWTAHFVNDADRPLSGGLRDYSRRYANHRLQAGEHGHVLLATRETCPGLAGQIDGAATV